VNVDVKQYAADKIFGINHMAIDKEHQEELGEPTSLPTAYISSTHLTIR
jgi:hypothetical protein